MSNRRSKFTIEFEKKYPKNKSKSKSAISKHFNIPLSVLNEVYSKGVGAFRTAGARPSVQSEDQWARARMYKLILNILKARKGGSINMGRGQDGGLVKKALGKK